MSSLLVDPNYPMNPFIYSHLSNLGFRRSGRFVYVPSCPDCTACLPIRVPVATFRPSRIQRRTWRRNQSLVVRTIPASDDDTHYALYQKYIETRHVDGDMFPPKRRQFCSFMKSDWSDTVCFRFFEDERLLAVMAVDRLHQGLSAVYSFFDPDESRRSLGVYMVLWLIRETQQLGLDYVYLGYYIEDCPKMSYKNQYRPFETMVNRVWDSRVDSR